MFSGADGTRNAQNRGAERPPTAFVSHDSPAESMCRDPSGPQNPEIRAFLLREPLKTSWYRVQLPAILGPRAQA